MIRTMMMMTVVLATTVALAGEDAMPRHRAVLLGVAHHPALKGAEADVEAARARTRQQGAWPNPELFLELEGAPRDGDAWDGADRVFGIEQTIPWGGRLSAGEDAARHRATSREWDRFAVLRNVEAEIQTAFARALHAREAAALQGKVVESARRVLGMTELRFESGDATADDVAHARYELGAAELTALRAEADRTATEAGLAVLLGLEDLPELVGELGPRRPVPLLEDLLSDLSKSPPLRSAESLAAAGLSDARSASRSRLPDLGVSLGMRRLGGGGGEAVDAGVSLAIPLFDRGGARASAARAEAVSAEAQARSVRVGTERRVRMLHARLSAVDAAVQAVVADLLPAADAVLAATERRYELGDVELTELLLVRDAWAERNLDALDLRLELDVLQTELGAIF